MIIFIDQEKVLTRSKIQHLFLILNKNEISHEIENIKKLPQTDKRYL